MPFVIYAPVFARGAAGIAQDIVSPPLTLIAWPVMSAT